MLWTEVKTTSLEEYTTGRITGKDYAAFLLGLIQVQMQVDSDAALKEAQVLGIIAENAIKEKELLIKDKELLLKDKELLMQQAQIDLATAEIGIKQQELLIKGEELLIAQQELLVKTAQVDVMVREIVLKESQSASTIANTTADTAIKTYQVNFLMPAEKAKMEADALVAAAEVDIKAQEILIKTSQLDIMGREITLKETESTSNVANIVAETALKTSQKVMIDQQKLTEVEQTAKAAYEVINLLPLQKDGITAENSIKNSQKTMIDQQKLTEAQQTAKALYEVTDILPAQKAMTEEQINTELQKQESMGVEDTVKKSQKAMIDQQKLTEVQQTAKALYEYTNILPKQKDLVIEQVATETAKATSMAADDTLKVAQGGLIAKQALTEVQKEADIVSTITVRNAQSQKDLLVKDQQEIAEKIKNGGSYYTYTYDVDGNVTSKTLQPGTTKSIHEYQADKMLADTNFVKEQKTQLGYSVTYNNRIKVSEKYIETLGNIALGGLSVPAAMWTTYFEMANDLYTNYGSVPVAKNVSVPQSFTLAKIV